MSLSSSFPHKTRWKPPIILLPPSVSVSFVLAEPEQTRSLSSAADSLLPNMLRRAMLLSQTDTTPVVTEGHDQSSIASDSSAQSSVNAVDRSNQSLSDPLPTTAPLTTPDEVLPVTPSPDQPSPTPPGDPSNMPTAVSQDPTPVHPLSDKRSWFNLFWSTNDKETSITEVKVAAESAPNTPDAVHICTESSENELRADFPKSIRPSDLTIATGDSDSPTNLPSLPEDAMQVSRAASTTPKPVQADPLSVQLPVSENHSSVSQTQKGMSPPVAPNSGISIFPFNFPMFTKPQPPPENATTTSSGDLISTPDHGNDENTSSVDESESPHMTPSLTAHVSECGDQSLSQATPVSEVRTNTWWSYLGWSGNFSAAQANSSPQNDAQTKPIGVHTSSAVPDQPLTSDPEANSQPRGEVTARKDMSSAVSGEERSQPGDNNSSSILEVNAARVPSGSTWQGRWFWHQPSSPTTVEPEIDSGSQLDPPAHSPSNPKTEEKESAGRRKDIPSPDQASSPARDLSATRSVDYSNPIQSVISANPTGWMSFFTAKSMAMKSITQDREDGKMEVMLIDEEMSCEPNSVSPSASAVTQSSPAQVAKPPVRAQHAPGVLPPSSSPLSKKSDDGQLPTHQVVTNSETAAANGTSKRQPSPSPSKKSSIKIPASPPPPNLVLPTWHDTFYTLPRSALPREPSSTLSKTLQYVSGVLFCRDETPLGKGKAKAKETVYSPYDKALPRTWDVLSGGKPVDVLMGCKRVVIIGVHGWFPGAVLRTFAGEPTGTSSRFVNGIADALDLFQDEHKMKLDKVTKIPLDGEGTINRRVERLYQNLIGNKEWMEDLHDADAIFVAAHSQGSVVSTHILDRLIADGHVRTALNTDASAPASGIASGSVSAVRLPQRICCLALCGIHHGPLRYLSTSSLVQPYIQYFESTAARELFEYQNAESALFRDYVRALRNVLNNGIKMVYVASLTDQVVGLYSGLFTSVSHPLILRALYIDGDAYHPSDFLSNLLVLLIRIRNAGLSDGGLLTHLSEITAGSLNGLGHSTPYEERATYSLAVNYLFLTDGGACGTQVELLEEPFNPLAERNDYEIPWALRELAADERVAALFADEIMALRDAFRHWHPKTTILRDVKRKLQPIQRLSAALMGAGSGSGAHASRL